MNAASSNARPAQTRISRAWFACDHGPSTCAFHTARIVPRGASWRNGTLDGEPQVLTAGSDPSFCSTAESAVRAIRLCQPLRVEGIDHARRKVITITLDPRPAFSGR
jgi:hypothetical protein